MTASDHQTDEHLAEERRPGDQLAEERNQKIQLYGDAYIKLIDALSQFPREMWKYRPAPDRWSIHEIVIHILDSEVNSYIRCRKCIAEPGSAVTAYDGDRWAVALNYHEQNLEDALDLFNWLRGRTYRLLLALPDEVWSHTIEHPENGTMTLDDWLDVYARHIPEHVEQMWAVYAAWIKA